MNTEVQFPTLKDTLFKSDTDWQNNACLNFQIDNWGLYASGYKKAADKLCLDVINSGRNQDTLVYPIVFNYRQYMELTMKEVLKNGYFLFDIELGIPKVHDLEKLWVHCKSIAKKLWPSESVECLLAMDQIIKAFSLDPQGDGFRYPEARNRQPTLESLKYINIRNLYEVMQKVSALLDGVNSGVADAYDSKCDFLSEMYSMY